jgi:phenylalanyl-tRNA synthetase beta chain
MFEVSGTYEAMHPKVSAAWPAACVAVRRRSTAPAASGRTDEGRRKPVGVFDAKADALAVLEACGAPVDNVQVENRRASLVPPRPFRNDQAGPEDRARHFGEFHPKTLGALDVSGALCGFEVYLDVMPEPKKKATRTKPPLELSPFQVVKRDFAFVVDSTVEAGAIIKAATSADRKLITGVNVFDIFEGASLGEGRKSVAIEVLIQPVERTLTDEDFEALTAKIVGNVEKSTGGTLRA